MARPIEWHGQNKVLSAPKNDKDRIQDLHVFNNGNCTVSCWQLTNEELAELIQNNGKVYLCVWYGPTQPPVFVGTEDNVRELVIDYGGAWKREKKHE